MISYGRHSINQDDINAVTEVLRGDWLTTGPLVEKFESAISNYVGSPSVVVSSGTAALHSAYAAIGISEGDEVITPGNTFIATQATAALLGAKIKFADIQADTGNIDPNSVVKQITSKTKAIVAVDYAGHPADLAELKNIAESNNIILIEDAAHSLGSNYQGKRVGSIADITTFSFYPTKNITSGEGGAVLTKNPIFLERARLFSRQGLVRDPNKFKISTDAPWHQEVHNFGLNYRLPDILCALGLSQLKRIEAFKSRRKDIFEYYSKNIPLNSGVVLPTQKNDVDPMWHLFPIRVPEHCRRSLFDFLQTNEVGVQVNYFPAFMHPVFGQNNEKMSNPETTKFYLEELSLPMSSHLSDSNVEKVVDLIKKYFK
jgi:dTDP-4-amino-4,6-dideoxygalactose transaminase